MITYIKKRQQFRNSVFSRI